MTRTSRRREAALVLVGSATALCVALVVPVAGALPGVDDDPTTATVEDVVDDAVDVATTLVGGTPSTSSSTSSTTTTSTTTTTTSTPTSTTTVVPAAEARTTRAPAAAGPAPTAPAPPAGAGGGGDGGHDPAAVTVATDAVPDLADVPLRFGEQLVDPPARPILAGPRSTAGLLDTLSGLGASPSLVASVLAPFPVAGPAQYTDDWHAPRHGGRLHKGTDIFAARGTPVIAAADGVVGNMTTTARLGGTSLRVTTTGGTYFYYAHLDRFAAGLRNGTRVRSGDVIGFVGNTGNAITTPPHLHFQVHPAGSVPVRPVPYLDRWLAEAATRVAAIAGSSSADAVLRPMPVPADPAEPSVRRPSMPALQPTLAEHQPAGEVDPLLAGFVLVPAAWAFRRWRRRRLPLVRVGP